MRDRSSDDHADRQVASCQHRHAPGVDAATVGSTDRAHDGDDDTNRPPRSPTTAGEVIASSVKLL
jgi:hypothetical protein